MEKEIYWGLIGSYEDAALVCCGEEEAELKGMAFESLVNLESNPHLWS